MTREQEFFLGMLTDHIAKKKTNPASELDWKLLAKWAKMHQVESIMYYQCRHCIPPTISALLEKSFAATLFQYKNRERLLASIDKEFEKQGIPFLTIKGIEIAKYYPLPFLRTMGDSDILVHKYDKERAGNALESLGFRVGERSPDYDWVCSINGMLFELHHNLLYQEIVTVDIQARFFNDYWNYVKNGKLDWSFHFLYLLAHLRKHIMESGAGFRMFMDLAIMINANSSLNWTWIKEKLDELGMLRFSQVCFALIERWFGICAPIEYPNLNLLFFEKTTDKVFENGVFGFDNEDNKINSSVNQLAKSGAVNWRSRLSMFLHYLFPSYNNITNSPYYHFVRGRIWLMPIAWIYRIMRLVSGRTETTEVIIKRVMMPQDMIEERLYELEEWGLK